MKMLENMAGNRESVLRACLVCEVMYRTDAARLTLYGRGTTCSRKCSYLLRSKNKSRKVSVMCAVCKTEFSRSPAQVKGKHGSDFCSRKCHYAGRGLGLTHRVVTKPYVITDAGRAAWLLGNKKTVATRRQRDNYVHSEATKAKLSEAAARQLARTKNVFASSKIEGVVARELDLLGVTYERQFVFRDPKGRFSAVVDFWFPTLRRVLEVNGTFWHADPRFYSSPLLPIQERAVAKYQRKLEALSALCIPVHEVWEMDLKKEPGQAVRDAYTKLSAS